MPAKPRKQPSTRPAAGKRRKREHSTDGPADRLGRLLEQHGVALAGLLWLTGLIGLPAVGCLVFGFTRQPTSIILLVIGGLGVLCALALAGINIFNVGRRLELRKDGIRFTQAGVVTEFLWDEISDVEVNRTDDTYLGAASIVRESSDTVSPSGLLTKTEWDVTIHGPAGRSIRLSPIFMRCVAKPKDLLRHLRLRSGLH